MDSNATHDRGLTHIALPVTNLDESIAFYARYARMEVVHRRAESGPDSAVAWISDKTRPFVVVLLTVPRVDHPLLPSAHLGVGCESRAEVDALCALAQEEGRLRRGPVDSGAPVGYWAILSDPDEHTLEISYGQEVAFTVARAGGGSMSSGDG
jgi:catechol 2,3-dioxygenase-like lactoylglutathione lyase family enzyme